MLVLRYGEPLEEAYQRWWLPTWTSPVRVPEVPRVERPHCGRWYWLPAPMPTTARWALVHVAHAPGMIIYTKSREALEHFLEILPLQHHPHVRVIAVDPRQPEALNAWLTARRMRR